MRIGRRSVLKGFAASYSITVLGSGAFAQASGPSDASQIEVAKAKAEGKVHLYTSLDTQIVDAVIAPFKEKYGINVEYFRGGAADVSAKVLAEADAGRTQVDMVDASDLAALLVMKDRKLLKAFKSKSIEAIAADLRDPDGTWITDRLTQAVIQYNTQEFGSNPPKSWADLRRIRTELLGVVLNHRLRQAIGDPGAIRIAQIRGNRFDRFHLKAFSSLRSFITSSAARSKRRPCRLGCGLRRLRPDLGRNVRGAAAEILDVDAVFLLERRNDGIDDLRVEARIKKNLALGFRLGNLDLRSIGGAGCLSEGARSEHGDRVTGGETFENRTTSNSHVILLVDPGSAHLCLLVLRVRRVRAQSLHSVALILTLLIGPGN